MADSETAALVASREYTASLQELMFNSKPQINALTIVADENRKHATQIIRTVETRLSQVSGQRKMPLLYLLDSIVKNLGGEYIDLVTQNLVSTFCSAFEQGDEQMRRDLFKLRQTWPRYFPVKKLNAIDVRVNAMDPNWPIIGVGGPIHVNPKFISQDGNQLSDPKSKPVSQPVPPVRRVEVVTEKPTRERQVDATGRPDELKERPLERRDQRQLPVERGEQRHERHVTAPVPPQAPVSHSRNVYETGAQNRPPSEPRRSPRADERNFSTSDAKRPRLDAYPQDRDRFLAKDHEPQHSGRSIERRADDFTSERDAMDAFHRLIRVPPNHLLNREKYILNEAEALLQCRYLEDKEHQALYRLLKELYHQQTADGRKQPVVEQRLAAPIKETVRPPEERAPPPRLLHREEEVELLRQKQQEDIYRVRREEEERRKQLLLHGRQTWGPESRDRLDQRMVNGNQRRSQEPGDVTVKPHMANNVSELFQRLLQTGILSEAQKTANSDYNTVGSTQRPPLPEVKLVPSELREPRNMVVVGLYSGQQCPTCGGRFVGVKSDEYGAHLDWHFKLKRREKANKIPTRKWMFPAEDWVKFVDYDKLEDTARSTVFDMEKEEVMTKERKLETCPVHSEDEEVCPICHEAFEQFWEEEHEEWHFKDAVRINGIVYHVACYEDAKESEGRPSVAVANEQNKAVEVPEKGSNDNTGIDENVEQQSTSVVIESEKRDENRPTTAS